MHSLLNGFQHAICEALLGLVRLKLGDICSSLLGNSLDETRDGSAQVHSNVTQA